MGKHYNSKIHDIYNKTIIFRVSPDIYDFIVSQSDKYNLSVSDYLRKLVLSHKFNLDKFDIEKR